MYTVGTGTLEVDASLVKTVLESQSTIKTLGTFRSYLHSCQPAYYMLSLLTKIVLTIAVTSAESEPSFYALKRIKTHLRTRMAGDRLSDLATLAIEKEVAQQLDYDKIIDEFASIDKNRCIILF